MSDRCSQVLEEVHRLVLAAVSELAARAEPGRPRRLLDVGCWDGRATRRYADAFHATALGIEIFEGPAAEARARGVEVAQLDLECEPFPWREGAVDVVIANQVLEHLKNVWLPMAEMVRVVRPGGWIVLSVPNLASLHNRALLAIGRQPTSLRTAGPHVRGFTLREIREFMALGGALSIERVRGAGFYPLSARWSRSLAALWRGASHTVVVVARKRAAAGGNPWQDYLGSGSAANLQTYFPRSAPRPVERQEA